MRHSIPSRASRARAAFALTVSLLMPFGVLAHFQELIPTTEIVDADSGPGITLDLTFSHPMERGPVMPMGVPRAFGVLTPDGRQDLTAELKPIEIKGASAYQADYQIPAPGDYVFFVEPAPYWEAAEGVMIVHYTKTVVDGYGAEQGWDRMVGFPVEIQPLTRPYGLTVGALFTGLVIKDGKPAPFAEIEVEWRNDGSLEPPTGPFVNHVLKADANGAFSVALPRAGWWGFAALLAGDQPIPNPDGQLAPVEQGALLWVRARRLP